MVMQRLGPNSMPIALPAPDLSIESLERIPTAELLKMTGTSQNNMVGKTNDIWDICDEGKFCWEIWVREQERVGDWGHAMRNAHSVQKGACDELFLP